MFNLPQGGGDKINMGRGPNTHYTGSWVGQRGILDTIERTKFSLRCPESKTVPRSATHFATTLTALVSSFYTKASRSMKCVLLNIMNV